MTETVSKDTVQERRQCDRIEQRDRQKEMAEGMLMTYPESVNKVHRRSGQGQHQEGARDGMSERLRQGLQLRNKRKKGDRSLKGTKQRGKNSRRLAAAGRITASAPAATGHQENRQAEAEAPSEGEGTKPKKQPADRRQSRAGAPGSGPTARGAQWREPRTSQDPQRQ